MPDPLVLVVDFRFIAPLKGRSRGAALAPVVLRTITSDEQDVCVYYQAAGPTKLPIGTRGTNDGIDAWLAKNS